MNKVLPARGFRDFDPLSKAHKEDLLTRIRDVYKRYGFDEIETPVVEPLERLRDSDGGDNVGMIFQILKRGVTTEDLRTAANPSELCDLGLRYDLTVPLARFYASNQSELPEVLRSIQIGPVWRAERPQKGRFRQFTQCDIDILGEPSMLAEIELLIATLAALQEIGLESCVVRLNDRRLLDQMMSYAGVQQELRPRVLIVIDKLDKIGFDGVASSLLEFLPVETGNRLTSILRRLSSSKETTIDDFLREVGEPSAATDAILNHRSIMTAVRKVRGPASVRFDPTLVRGLGYYTGPIFEVEHPSSTSSVAGGGRYDTMIGKFLGKPVPACGFSLGFDRLLELTAKGFHAANKKVALIISEQAEGSSVFERQHALQELGFSVRLAKETRNMKRLYDTLASTGCTNVQLLSEPVTSMRELVRRD